MPLGRHYLQCLLYTLDPPQSYLRFVHFERLGLVSVELFTSGDIKNQSKISHLLSQSISVNGPYNTYTAVFEIRPVRRTMTG